MMPWYFRCPKVLPTVFDDSLSYYEVLCKLTYAVDKLYKMYGGFKLHKVHLSGYTEGDNGVQAVVSFCAFSNGEKITTSNIASFLNEMGAVNTNTAYPCAGSVYDGETNYPASGVYVGANDKVCVVYTALDDTDGTVIENVEVEDQIVELLKGDE